MKNNEPFILLVAGSGLLALSGWQPRDCFTWGLEVAPILLGVPVLIITFARFRPGS